MNLQERWVIKQVTMKIMPKHKRFIVMLAMRLHKFLIKNVPVDIEYRKLERRNMIIKIKKEMEQQNDN